MHFNTALPNHHTTSFQREHIFQIPSNVYEPPWRGWLVHPESLKLASCLGELGDS